MVGLPFHSILWWNPSDTHLLWLSKVTKAKTQWGLLNKSLHQGRSVPCLHCSETCGFPVPHIVICLCGHCCGSWLTANSQQAGCSNVWPNSGRPLLHTLTADLIKSINISSALRTKVWASGPVCFKYVGGSFTLVNWGQQVNHLYTYLTLDASDHLSYLGFTECSFVFGTNLSANCKVRWVISLENRKKNPSNPNCSLFQSLVCSY